MSVSRQTSRYEREQGERKAKVERAEREREGGGRGEQAGGRVSWRTRWRDGGGRRGSEGLESCGHFHKRKRVPGGGDGGWSDRWDNHPASHFDWSTSPPYLGDLDTVQVIHFWMSGGRPLLF